MALLGIYADAQIRNGTVTKRLLEASVQATLDDVPVVKQDLQDLIDSKGQPNGLPTLNALGTVSSSQINSIALKGKALPVSSEQEMLLITQTKDGNPMEQGDRVDRLDEGRTYIFDGGDLTDPANWTKILAENSAVTTIRNASGTFDETGVVVFPDMAISGNIADSNDAAAVATTGAAGDVSVADAAEKFDATDVEGVLAELDDKRIIVANNAAQAAASARDTAIAKSRLVSYEMLPGPDAKTRSIAGLGIDMSPGVYYRAERNGVDENQNGLATVDTTANTVAFNYDIMSDEPVTLVGYPL